MAWIKRQGYQHNPFKNIIFLSIHQHWRENNIELTQQNFSEKICVNNFSLAFSCFQEVFSATVKLNLAQWEKASGKVGNDGKFITRVEAFFFGLKDFLSVLRIFRLLSFERGDGMKISFIFFLFQLVISHQN